MAVIRLEADVQEAKQSQNLIDCIATVGIIQARSQEHVLNCLQKLHSEEEEHSGGQFRVVRSK